MGETTPQRWEHRSWRGKETPRPGKAECAEICRGNAREAQAALDRSSEAYVALSPGDARLEQVVQDIARHRSDVRHWEDLARWWEAQPEPPTVASATHQPAPPPPRSRVVGEDDGDDDAPGSAWAEMGYQR